MDRPDFYYRVYATPRMSAAMMGDYMSAEDDERETIVRNAKYAKTARVITYKEARRVIRRFLASDMRRLPDLYDAIESWNAELGNPSISPNRRDEVAACIEAVQAFIGSYNELGFNVIGMAVPPHRQPKLQISGVRVSTYLDALIMQDNTRHGPRIGGVLLQMSKGKAEPKREDTIAKRDRAGSYASLLVMRHLKEHFGHLGQPRADICFYVAVQKGKLWTAPQNHIQADNRMDAAARVIAREWDGVVPPADFDPAKAKFVA